MKYRVRRDSYDLHGDVNAQPFVRVVSTDTGDMVLERAAFADFPDVPDARHAVTGLPLKNLSFVVGVQDYDADHFLVDVRSVYTTDPNWRP